MWQLETERGLWAVKTAFGVPEELDGEDAELQSAAHAAGVPVPAVARTRTGEVFAVIGGVHVRAYEWVAILPPDRTLDPAAVGRIVADMHRVEYTGRRPEDPWYTDPVGADAWDCLSAISLAPAHRSPATWRRCGTTSSSWRR